MIPLSQREVHSGQQVGVFLKTTTFIFMWTECKKTTNELDHARVQYFPLSSDMTVRAEDFAIHTTVDC